MTQLRFAALVAALLALPAGASAQASLLDGFGGAADYGTDCLGMNDDGASNAIDITPYFPAGLRFFDRTHSRVHINTNGNISFSDPVPSYAAEPFPVADQPMIAPYWADVDIRAYAGIIMGGGPPRRGCEGPADADTTIGPACHDPTENGIWWHLEEGRMVVTWDRVAAFKCREDNGQRMSFQLVITAVDSASCGATGDFDVEFRYNRCDWTIGADAVGAEHAQAGFDAGNSRDYVEIPGSRTTEIGTILCTGSNVGDVSADPSLAGIWRFQIRSGEVICPGAGDACDTSMMGVCSTGRTQCVADTIECRPEIGASDEVCDALDNDCDGTTDEGDTICGDFEICRDGSCIGNCFEGGCPSGFTCVEGGLCVEDACVDVTCDTGERCEGGTCVSPCADIVCPGEQTCVAGTCVDLCAGATCDDCSVCDGGACVPRCDADSCPSGEACRFDGLCVEASCVDVSCSSGEVCRGGSCVDACDGAVCPGDDVCTAGACGPPPPVMEDGGVPPQIDGGFTPTPDGGPSAMDGGGVPGVDAGGGAEEDGGCGCRAAGRPGPSPLWLAPLAALLVLRRRRG